MNDHIKHLLLTFLLVAVPKIGLSQLKAVTDVYSAKQIECEIDFCLIEIEYSYDNSKGKIAELSAYAYTKDEALYSKNGRIKDIEYGVKNHQIIQVLRPNRITAFTTNKVKVSISKNNGDEFFKKYLDLELNWPSKITTSSNDSSLLQESNDELLYKAIEIIDGNDGDEYIVAKKYLERIIFNDPKYVQAYIELARIAMKSDSKFTEHGLSQGALEAERILKTALTIDKNYANSYILYGYVMAVQNKPEQAIAAFKRAQQIGTLNLWLYSNWGLALKNAERYDEAIQIYSQALINIPTPVTPLMRSNNRAIPIIFSNLEELYAEKQNWQALEALLIKRAETTHNICVNTKRAKLRLLHFSDIEQAMKMATIAYDEDCDESRTVLASVYISKWALDSTIANEDQREQLLRKGQALADNTYDLIIMLASSDYTAQALSKLKSTGLNIDIADEKGITPLAYAAIMNEQDVMKRLVNLGADPNRKLNEHGLTILMLSIVMGQYDSVKTLVALGANVKTKASDGTTALQLAKQSGRNDIVDILQNKNLSF